MTLTRLIQKCKLIISFLKAISKTYKSISWPNTPKSQLFQENQMILITDRERTTQFNFKSNADVVKTELSPGDITAFNLWLKFSQEKKMMSICGRIHLYNFKNI